MSDPDVAADRINALAAFAARFAPAIGEVKASFGPDVEDQTTGEILHARNRAIVACFDAIERLARGC